MPSFDFDIDLKSNFPEVWFGDTPGKKVCLRLPDPEMVKKLRKEMLTPKKKPVLNTTTRKMELADDDTDCDYDGFFVKLTSLAIVTWDINDVSGAVIECNEENKARLLDDLRFVDFVKACLEELNQQARALKDEESKNFGSSPGGS